MAKPDRNTVFEELNEKPLDLLIIGGGILGAGIARDAAMRKLRVGLFEQNDLASGTSSRSSRLIHGGLRYLGQGHLKLVREASREKAILHKIAPHLVHPITFLFPAYRNSSFPLWKLSIGVKLYDWFTRSDAFADSDKLSKKETLKQIPFLNSSHLKGSVTYTDGQTLDSRLVIDTLLSAYQSGARISPQTEVLSSEHDGTSWSVTVLDKLKNEKHVLKSHCVINATGPWMGQQDHAGIKIRPTKGVHLVFDKADFPLSSALVLPAGKRILFAIPWGDRVILGTTDTDYKGDLTEPSVEAEDIEYLLHQANQYLGGEIQLTQEKIISAWAGIRPLIDDSKGRESQISRKHKIKDQKYGWWDVAGGKLTSYRLIAEDTVDKALDFLKMRARRCKTAKQPLLPINEVKIEGILPPPLDMDLVTYFCEEEWALHLTDVMDRRTGWAQYDPPAPAILEKIAKTMAASLNWTPEQTQQEIQDYESSRAFKK